jgi:hypothetical protein
MLLGLHESGVLQKPVYLVASERFAAMLQAPVFRARIANQTVDNARLKRA